MLIFSISLASESVFAEAPPEHFDVVRTANCALDASKRFEIPYLLLMALKVKESGVQFTNPHVTRRNSNGTSDRGYWQVNDFWLPKLAPYGIDRARLYDPCVNAHVAAWLVRSEVQRKGSWEGGIGSYHSPTPWRARAYAAHAMQIWAKLKQDYPGWN
ncbi:lytic transglycosylase domain-containing protein (plasmid) [Vogesella sp. XCS3]|nr:lytic transglycosylase domain-containing protein [Vogesella sp. XCS3]